MSIHDDLARIALQEQQLQFATFHEETAWRLGSSIHALAVERNLSLVVDVRRFGQPLFYAALAGTTPDNVEWVRRKSNVTARFHRSSYAIGLEMEEKKSNLFDRYGLPIADFASHGGSFPLRVVGAGVIGSLTVSGLPQRADHQLAVEALCKELEHPFDTLRLD
ncbi:MAG TPA: heme-degrading domain-containing protein [Acidobacteriaceae bacterium]|nr:heme-degrading domain-containing protein [Acidobacteriaceae bacterium]